MTEILFHTVEGWIAVITFYLILCQLVLSVIGMDFDSDMPDIDADFGGWDLSTLYSVKGIIQFLAGASWYLVLAQLYNPLVWSDYFIAILIGLVVDVLIALLYYGLSKLQSPERTIEPEQFIGSRGVVYLDKGNGTYIVTVGTLYGTQEVLVKTESGKKFKVGDVVLINKIQNGILYI